MVKAIAEAWPSWKPKDAVLDAVFNLAERAPCGGIETKVDNERRSRRASDVEGIEPHQADEVVTAEGNLVVRVTMIRRHGRCGLPCCDCMSLLEGIGMSLQTARLQALPCAKAIRHESVGHRCEECMDGGERWRAWMAGRRYEGQAPY